MQWGFLGRVRTLGCAFVVIGAVGCSDNRVLLPGAESSTEEPSPGTITTSSSSSTSPTTSTTALADDTTAAAMSTGDGVVFLPVPDVGADDECDLSTQNCPPDQKCMPWGEDGGLWDAWGCKPLAENPVGIDEVCHLEGPDFSGLDDCERGAMCFNVDPETNEGTCAPFCVGGQNDSESGICEDPQRSCVYCNACQFALCVPNCDPLAQDCPEGQACYPSYQYWGCGPDASGDAGAYGDPCEFDNLCALGLVCVAASAFPPAHACGGTCCTEVCDLADPLGDLQCAGAADGQRCLPWDDDGLPGYEDVGLCILP